MTPRTPAAVTWVRLAVALAGICAAAGPVSASSAGFVISAEGVTLGKADESGEIPTYRVKVPVGQTVTLTAQGRVMPRGAAAQPGEAEAAAWLFDDAAFELAPSDAKKADRTRTAVSLTAVKAGETRVRFVGVILGYKRKFDVICEVVPAK